MQQTFNMASIRRVHLILLTTLLFQYIHGENFGINNGQKRPNIDTLNDRYENDHPRSKLKKNYLSDKIPENDASDIKNDNNNSPYNSKEQSQLPAAKPNTFLLAEEPHCREDVEKICEDKLKNNFAILDCLQKLQNDKDKNTHQVSDRCQHVIWNYKRNLTLDSRFIDATNQVCNAELPRFKECTVIGNLPGHLLSCLMDEKENMTDPQCKQYLTKMASIVFGDYRLIYKFTENCEYDINRFKCGRVPDNQEFNTQGSTIECLSTKNLTETCRGQILRIAELQSDDFQLDRALYYACRDDRELFCERVRSGEGRVYKCLMKHKMEREMSSQCREKLFTRQKLINQDYKVSHGLAQACRDDIKAYKCRSHVPANTREVKLSFILLCLEDAMHKGQVVSNDCQAEMLEHRRSLMEDYRLNPNIVLFCDEEIRNRCNGLEKEGRTIHCLMKLAKDNWRTNIIGPQCQRELQVLLKEVDPVSDVRIDSALQSACQPVIDTACQNVRPGDAGIITCLMDKLDTEFMIEECEEHLLAIQYFISRDFRLDTRLYRLCHQDASKYCHAPKNWIDPPNQATTDLGPLVFPCLYRLAQHRQSEKELSASCVSEVKRVMRQRAISVNLMPEIEAPCMKDLARFCSKDVDKGEELDCLQKNLKNLEEKCSNALGNFTEEEAEDIELNHILMKACKPVIHKFCEDYLEQDIESDELMQCLILNKNNPKMNKKCAAGIEHFQLISLKDYRFNFKFKEACKGDVVKYCDKIKTKADVVECLSNNVREDVLKDNKHRITKDCRRQMKVELLQRNENINLDENLSNACEADIKRYCIDVNPENAQVLECLKNHRKVLSPSCHKVLFNREKDIMEDVSTDYFLMTVCKRMIKQFCAESDPKDILDCLKEKKDDLDDKCKSVLLKRQIEQSFDYRLNPKLQKACKLDLPKFCKSILATEKNDTELEGKAINCLKEQFRNHKLSPDCEKQIGDIMREAALNYQLNPQLSEVCNEDIKKLCFQELGESAGADGYGKVEECLKMKLQSQKIQNQPCKDEVLKLVLESQADIHVDPLLYKACAFDIKHYCVGIPPGQGRQLTCMLAALEDKSDKISHECKEKLKSRVEMFEFAAKVAPPESMNELVEQIVASKSKNYFIIIICAGVGIFFIGGLFCGRVTKRVHAELKNK